MIDKVITERLKVTENPNEPSYRLAYAKGWPVVIKKSLFSDIIGVERSGSVWRNIDDKCRALKNSIVKKSPCLTNITSVTVDGQAMVEIPKFYFLYQRVDSDDCERWWVSHIPFSVDGVGTSQVHNGFIFNGVVNGYFQIGAYEATLSNGKACSVVGVTPTGGVTYNNWKTYCALRGNGFMLQHIYQWGAVQMLCMIDHGTAAVESTIGGGVNAGGVWQVTGGTSYVWRGIHEIYGNCNMLTQGARSNNGAYSLSEDTGSDVCSPIGDSFSGTLSSCTKITTISKPAAEKGVFLPKTVGTARFGTGYARVTSGSSLVLQVGGEPYNNSTRTPGLMAADFWLNETSNGTGYFCARLARSRPTVVAYAAPQSGFTYVNDSYALNNSWNWGKIAEAISSNPEITSATDTVYIHFYDEKYFRLSVGTTFTAYSIRDYSLNSVTLLGFNHCPLSGNGYGRPTATNKAGLLFQLTGCFDTQVRIHSADINSCGWGGCELRNNLNDDINSIFSSEHRGNIKPVVRKTCVGDQSSEIAESVDKLFLPTEYEVFGYRTWSRANESGPQICYYANGGSKIKSIYAVGPVWWHLSSPDVVSGNHSFCAVTTDGRPEDTGGDGRSGKSSWAGGVSPCFCY